MKYFYACLLSLFLSSASGQLDHHISIGAQMPFTKLIDPRTGQNLAVEAFPAPLRYGLKAKGHSIGITFGGRINDNIRHLDPNGALQTATFRSYDARLDYRWYPASPERRWQPFVGGGFMRSITDFRLGDERSIGSNWNSLFAQAGLQVFILDWLYVETELPVRIAIGEVGLFSEDTVGEMLDNFWQLQRNQMWRIFSVGIKL